MLAAQDHHHAQTVMQAASLPSVLDRAASVKTATCLEWKVLSVNSVKQGKCQKLVQTVVRIVSHAQRANRLLLVMLNALNVQLVDILMKQVSLHASHVDLASTLAQQEQKNALHVG